MPKSKINDYIFYKITCLDDSVDLCYVGSTANWKERQRKHKSDCNNENSKKYNNKKYQIIRANGGWQNFKMIQIGTSAQLTIREAEKIEEDYRVELKANMNTIRCYRTQEQTRELAKEYREANKEYQAKYYTNNTDKLSKQMKEYKINNKDKINAHASEVITCECGCQVTRRNLATHKKSKKHINLLPIKDVSVVT